MKLHQIVLCFCWVFCAVACSQKDSAKRVNYQKKYPNILDIVYTPSQEERCTGWFVDQGAWIGFTPSEKRGEVAGFCGPFSLDSRRWLAKSAVSLSIDDSLSIGESIYYPGLLTTRLVGEKRSVEQSLIFADAQTALLKVEAKRGGDPLVFEGADWMPGSKITKEHNSILVSHPTGEITLISFEPEAALELTVNNYRATIDRKQTFITIAVFKNKAERFAGIQKAISYLNNSQSLFLQNGERWNGYLNKIIREDMASDYDRIAVKSLVTLISNWKTNRGGLLHEGIVPSHAVGYFMGFWAWDTWKFVVPLAGVTPKLAKNMIRSMFDYQLDDGMVIDCIYVDAQENNSRDSKPPLAAWAVDAVYEATKDTAFIKEMYPQLLAYYKWWYNKRDHDSNGFCEFGSTDGTVEAAAWESGMDNAIRFDNSKMVKNGDDAWSFNQESVDLNGFLAYEWRTLRKLSSIIDEDFEMPDVTDKIASYFYDDDSGYFYDKKIGSGEFIKEAGSEGYIPLWSKIASDKQVEKALLLLTDTTKFATYIPFPTIAADNPKYMSNGYWRGPIWLDQTYFAIKGLRNYGYTELADKYTEQVFNRLDGLKGGAPIHENYDSHTGGRLKAPHFSWSAAHLLLLYREYGQK